MSGTRIALVTGANKGLGFETSRQLSQQGIKVLMGSRSITRGRKAVRSLLEEALDVEIIHLDVTKTDHIRQAAKYIKEKYGRLDILINNAGMVHAEESSTANSAETVSPKALRATFDVNFFGLVELTQALLPLIRKSNSGRIVNVSSILGSLTLQSREEDNEIKPLAYDATKTAVNAFTIHLAAALKHTTVKVNSAHPGWVRTDLGGKKAPMGVEEGAKTAVRLATLGADGPSGRFFHLGQELPW
jgi:NAD(P)-dependent dehydrogenase (short-subunit alcohol dehydrogenase family)